MYLLKINLPNLSIACSTSVEYGRNDLQVFETWKEIPTLQIKVSVVLYLRLNVDTILRKQISNKRSAK